MIWQCNGKFKGEYRCGTPHLYEEGIKRLFLRAVADLTEDREVLLETCRMIHDEYLNTDTIDAECATLNDEIEIVSGLTKKLIAETPPLPFRRTNTTGNTMHWSSVTMRRRIGWMNCRN